MSYEFDTRCIHGNSDTEREHSYGAVTMPIYQTATFAHPGVGKSINYDYTRAGNPTRNELEHIVTSLEGGTDTVACASGMAAISLAIELFETGSNIVCTEDLYGGSVRMFDHVCSPHNPVGRVWTKEELQQVGEICLRHHVIVVADEIHEDFVFGGHKHTVFASLQGGILCDLFIHNILLPRFSMFCLICG